MAKAFLIIGKICSGKSYYAKQLKEKYNAVILSTDEATFDLIENEQGEFYNSFAERVNKYLMKKAAEIVYSGANVILDWGFWSKKDRKVISDYFASKNLAYEWHYIDISEKQLYKNINSRNLKKEHSDFYVDDILLSKCLDLFEYPTEINISVIIKH